MIEHLTLTQRPIISKKLAYEKGKKGLCAVPI